MAIINKSTNKQVLVRLRRKGNPSTVLVGMQTGAATVENSMEFPQKTKNGIAFSFIFNPAFVVNALGHRWQKTNTM